MSRLPIASCIIKQNFINLLYFLVDLLAIFELIIFRIQNKDIYAINTF